MSSGRRHRHHVTNRRAVTLALSTPHSQQRVTASAWSRHDTGVADTLKSRWRRQGTGDGLRELSHSSCPQSRPRQFHLNGNVNSSMIEPLLAEYLKIYC